MTSKERAQLNIAFWGMFLFSFLTTHSTFDSLHGFDKFFSALSLIFFAGWVFSYVWLVIFGD